MNNLLLATGFIALFAYVYWLMARLVSVALYSFRPLST